MTAPFFSQSWYRVAKLKPQLAEHVRVHRHRYRGQAWYVLEDKVSGKVHRLSPSAYAFAGRLDGQRTVEAIWTEVAAALDAHAPTQDDAISILAQIHAADLLKSDVTPDTAELLVRHRKQSGALWRQNLLNPMSFRVPLLDPTRLLDATLPLVRMLFSPFGFVLWLAIVAAAMVFAARDWAELTGNLADRVLAPDNLLVLLLVFPFVKILHELGHGYAVRAFGGEVRETGVMFLVFLPIPYVDATGAAAFRSKWRRIIVGGAGMMVELLLAAFAYFGWSALEGGVLRAVLFNVMVIAGVSTVLINGNPLLRFDGYYMLADFLEMPNLATRSTKYWGYLTETYAFKVEQTHRFLATLGERIAFVLYAPLAFVYRVFISVGIAIFVAQTYFIIGVLLAIWSLVMSVGFPLGKSLWHLMTSPKLRRQRTRAQVLTGVAVGLVGLVLFVVPFPAWTLSQGIIWVPEAAHVRTGADGFLRGFATAPGGEARVDQPLAVLEEPAFEARLAALDWRVRELELKRAQQVVTDPVLAELARLELDTARARAERERVRATRMTVRSAATGRFVSAAPADDMTGRFYREGELIGYVLPERAQIVRAIVPQADVDLVRNRLQSVELRFSPSGAPRVAGAIAREVPAGQFTLPSAALSLAGGGSIATDPRDEKGVTALARVFHFDIEIPALDRAPPFASRVEVKFRHAPEPIGWQAYRRLRQLFLASFNA